MVAADPAPECSSPVPAQAPTLLLAEDDPRFRSVVAELLRDVGYTVIEAANGLDALIHLRRHRQAALPALILLDLLMPQMDGRAFRREQLADPVLATIPVVVLSGVGCVDAEAEVVGVEHYLRKPVALPDLLHAIRRYCA
jgi:CheY-like chemotaxis protein